MILFVFDLRIFIYILYLLELEVRRCWFQRSNLVVFVSESDSVSVLGLRMIGVRGCIPCS